jgi:hypothetical protein
MVSGSGVITAFGQVKQPMKLVQSSPRGVPGAAPASGSLQSKPNIDTSSPGGSTLAAARLPRLAVRSAKALRCSMKGSLQCGDAHVVLCLRTTGVST